MQDFPVSVLAFCLTMKPLKSLPSSESRTRWYRLHSLAITIAGARCCCSARWPGWAIAVPRRLGAIRRRTICSKLLVLGLSCYSPVEAASVIVYP